MLLSPARRPPPPSFHGQGEERGEGRGGTPGVIAAPHVPRVRRAARAQSAQNLCTRASRSLRFSSSL